jgi:hypothetical protein
MGLDCDSCASLFTDLLGSHRFLPHSAWSTVVDYLERLYRQDLMVLTAVVET